MAVSKTATVRLEGDKPLGTAGRPLAIISIGQEKHRVCLGDFDEELTAAELADAAQFFREAAAAAGYKAVREPVLQCTCGASKDIGAAGHSPSCPLKKTEG